MSPDRDVTTFISSDITASSTPANAFATLMGNDPNSVIQPIQRLRDHCSRPTPTYNFNYNPHKPQRDDLPRCFHYMGSFNGTLPPLQVSVV